MFYSSTDSVSFSFVAQDDEINRQLIEEVLVVPLDHLMNQRHSIVGKCRDCNSLSRPPGNILMLLLMIALGMIDVYMNSVGIYSL